MATVDTFLIELALDNKKLLTSLQQSQAQIGRFASNIKSTMINVGEVLGTLGVADFAKHLVDGFAKAGTNIYYTSRAIGESTSTLDAWGKAAARVGGSAQATQQSIGALYTRLNNAKFQQDPVLSGLLNYAGVKAVDANGNLRKTTDVLTDLSAAFAKMPHNKQEYLGRQLGLDQGTINLLQLGKVGLQQYLQVAKENGVWTDAQAKKAAALNSQIAIMNQRWQMAKVNMGEKLMPVALQLMNQVIIPLINDIPKLINGFTEFSHSMGLTGTKMTELIVGIMAFAKLSSIIRMVAASFGLLDAAALPVLGPIVAIAAALTAVAGAYELIKHGKGGKLEAMGALSGNFAGSLAVGAISMAKKYMPSAVGGIEHLAKTLGLGSLGAAQAFHESNGKNEIGYKYLTQNGHLVRDAQGRAQFARDAQGNKIPEAYGIFQEKPSSASRVMGRNITGQELLGNIDLQKEVYKRMMAEAMKASGGDVKGALAYYNGGQSDLDYYRRTGQTKNQYGEIIASNAAAITARNQMPKTKSMAATYATNNQNNKNINVTHNYNLPNVQNSQDFINAMSSPDETPWSYSHNRLV